MAYILFRYPANAKPFEFGDYKKDEFGTSPIEYSLTGSETREKKIWQFW